MSKGGPASNYIFRYAVQGLIEVNLRTDIQMQSCFLTGLDIRLFERPGVTETITFGPWIIGVEHDLVSAGDPGAPTDRGNYRGFIAYPGFFDDAAVEA